MNFFSIKRHIPIIRKLFLFAASFLVLIVTSLMFLKVGDRVECIGTVNAKEELSLLAPERATITSILVEEGDQVKKGDLLLELDVEMLRQKLSELDNKIFELVAEKDLASTRLKLLRLNPLPKEFENLEAELELAQATMEFKKEVYENAERMYKKEFASSMEVETANLQYVASRVSLEKIQSKIRILDQGYRDLLIEKAEKEFDLIKTRESSLMSDKNWMISRLDECQVRAEKDGVVISLPMDAGDLVQKDTVVCSYVTNSKKILKAMVSDEEVQELQIGQEVLCYSDHYDKLKVGSFSGVVSSVDLQPNNADSLYAVEIDVSEAPYELRLGSGVELEIIVEDKPLWELCLAVFQ